MKIQKAIILLGVVLMCASTTTVTRAADNEEDGWQFISTPFLWGTGIEGDLTLRGTTLNVDLGFDDLLDVTDYGFQTYLELRKRKFGFYAAPSYMKLSGDGSSARVRAEFELHFWLVEGGGFYNLYNSNGEKRFSLDVLAGARYWNIDTSVELRGTGPVGARREFGGIIDIIDPVVGLRMRQYLTSKLSLGIRGDVGGFGISEGDTSNFSWQATGLVGYDFNDKYTLFAGYRALGIDADEDDNKNMDLTFHGALLGLQISW